LAAESAANPGQFRIAPARPRARTAASGGHASRLLSLIALATSARQTIEVTDPSVTRRGSTG